MQEEQVIKHLKHNEIDKAKWDECIDQAENGLVYAFSWYLDIVSPKWEALIFGDYNAVFPLPVKRKYGIRFIAQPLFTQQLGWFGEIPLEIGEIFKFLRQNFIFGFMNLNSISEYLLSEKQIKANLILPLKSDYSNLSKCFTNNHRRNIKKAKNAKLFIRDANINEFLKFYRDSNWTNKFGFKEAHLNVLVELIQKSIQKSCGRLLAIFAPDNEIVAACFLPITTKRITYFFPVASQKGYNLNAQFFLIDHLINIYAGKNVIFDFDGSSIAGIAKFYRGFGSVEEKYYSVKFAKNFFYQRMVDKII